MRRKILQWLFPSSLVKGALLCLPSLVGISPAAGIEPARMAAALAPPAFPHAFEPVSPNAIGRFWGIGPGRGFHVVPMGPYQARFHHCVTAAGMPHEEDYHPNRFGKMLSSSDVEPLVGGWQHLQPAWQPQEPWIHPSPVAPVQPTPNFQAPMAPTRTTAPILPRSQPTSPESNESEKSEGTNTDEPEVVPLPKELNPELEEKGWSDADPALTPKTLDKLFEDEVHPYQKYLEPKAR